MVALTTALQDGSRLFLDTAPVIYYIEQNPTYLAISGAIFAAIEAGTVIAVTSPITLAECLIHPYRLGIPRLPAAFVDVITRAENTLFQPIDAAVAQQAAMLRANYNLTLTDALQIAVALAAHSDVFLTNDLTLKRVTELRIVVLGDLSAN